MPQMQAEADFWKRSEGYRTGWSDEILGFDCGGEQWVLEVAFPTGTQKYVPHALFWIACPSPWFSPIP